MTQLAPSFHCIAYCLPALPLPALLLQGPTLFSQEGGSTLAPRRSPGPPLRFWIWHKIG